METKFAALMLIPLIALVALDTTYSLWQENLTITGTITTSTWGTEIRSHKIIHINATSKRSYQINWTIK